MLNSKGMLDGGLWGPPHHPQLGVSSDWSKVETQVRGYFENLSDDGRQHS